MIEIRDVSFTYASGGERGIRHISLRIRKGETVLLVGESGCGKTTVTRLINGLIPNFYEGQMEGSTAVGGIPDAAGADLYDIARHVGSIFQNPRNQFFNVDTDSEIAFSCENMRMPPDEIDRRVNATVEEMDISALMHRSIFGLSGGEKQKIACACVRAFDPDIYVFDEPSSNLDVSAIDDLRSVLMKIKKSGKTVVIAEHRLNYLRNIADRVIFMADGRIIREYTGTEFFALTDDTLHTLGLRTAGHFRFGNEPEDYASGSIEFSDISFCRRNGKKVVDIEKLCIPIGSVCAIIGQNGAGKTTLIRSLCGLERKAKGSLKLNGKKLSRRQRRNSFYLVMQDVNHQLFTESVMDEVLLSMPEEDRKKAKDILESLDLDTLSDLHPMALSGGQKQRAAIAAGIASERNTIILDEPTSGLDYRHMEEIAKAVLKMKEQGKTVVIVTHDPELIERSCNYFVFMKDGKVAWSSGRCPETAARLNAFFM